MWIVLILGREHRYYPSIQGRSANPYVNNPIKNGWNYASDIDDYDDNDEDKV